MSRISAVHPSPVADAISESHHGCLGFAALFAADFCGVPDRIAAGNIVFHPMFAGLLKLKTKTYRRELVFAN